MQIPPETSQAIAYIGTGLGIASAGIGIAIKVVKDSKTLANGPDMTPLLDKLDQVINAMNQMSGKADTFFALQNARAASSERAIRQIDQMWNASRGRRAGDAGFEE